MCLMKTCALVRKFIRRFYELFMDFDCLENSLELHMFIKELAYILTDRCGDNVEYILC